MREAALLSVRGLAAHFVTRAGTLRAVDGVDLDLASGEVLGLVGESGCGKTVLALSLMRLVEPPGRLVAGSITFDGNDVTAMDTRTITRLRGRGMGMIFQQPRTSLDPVIRIGNQIAEPLISHAGMSRAAAAREAIALLEAVGIPGAEAKARAYPHELSGGQAQRVMIAIALALKPRLLIADEPTTSLDVTVQAQILALLRERCRALGTALILVTHDIGVVAQLADRVAVMYAGRIVEQGPVGDIFAAPAHPYTQGLLQSAPVLGRRRERLAAIEGNIPDLSRPIPGCAFAPRCDHRPTMGERCDREMPPALAVTPAHAARCWRLATP
ncbi:ABC transporter ATP-binding protein [Elioraea sp.]|uniref:ABC transporter ATP-binding protein n=1 Tax=Elioraea sp. TaxID=2185103 RepID=UPI0025BBB255|nr:ABC transporter ATP-binding protein [Elioraea sp.]